MNEKRAGRLEVVKWMEAKGKPNCYKKKAQTEVTAGNSRLRD